MLRESVASGTRALANPSIHLSLPNTFPTRLCILLRAACRSDGKPAQQLLAASTVLGVALLTAGCTMKGSTTDSSNAPQATSSPSSLDFGSQDVGIASSPLAVTLANTGNADLVVSNAAASPSQYVLSGLTSTTIGPGKQA